MRNTSIFKAEIYSFLSGLTACLGICATGINSGIISPIITELKRDNLVTEGTLPILTIFYFLGSLSGHFTTGYIASMGRKKFWIISLSLISFVANYIFLLGTSTISMFVARFVLGAHDAIVFSLFIVYTGEVVMDTRKNVYGTGLGVSLRLSILVVYFLGIWMRYRYIVIFSMALYTVVISVMIFQPTSPHWLIKKGYFLKAEKVLLHIYQDETVAAEKFNEINQQQQQEGETATTFVQKYKSVFKWPVLKPILIISTLQILKELSGHETIVGYCSVILAQHALNGNTTRFTLDPNIQALAYPSLLGIGSIVALFIVTRRRLKGIIIATTVGQLLAHLSMTSYFFVIQHQLISQVNIYRYLFVWGEVSIAMYGLFFSIGWGSLIYYLYIELFHAQHRELSSAACCVAMSVATISSLAVYGYVLEEFGGVAVFSAFSVTCVLAVIFQVLFI